MNTVTGQVIEIDARGMKCPWPVLRAARAMREAGPDTVGFIIRADDPIAEAELRALAAQLKWMFVVTDNGSFQLVRRL